MKTALAAAVVLALAAGRVTGQDLSPIRGAARVVSRVSYYSWEEPKGWVELEDRKTIVEEFGEDGRIRTRELFADGTLLEATTFSYSPAGVQQFTNDQNNVLLRRAEVKLVGGRTIETVYAGDGALLFSSVIQTDLAGRTIEAERRDARGVFVYRIRYLYDAKGNLLEAACLNPV